MKQNSNKGIIWLLVILIILVSVLIGLFIYNSFFEDKSTNEIIDNSKYEKVSTFNIIMNNKTHKIDYKYEIVNEKNEYNADYEENQIEVAKKQGDYVYNFVKVSVFIDNVFVKEVPILFDLENNLTNLKQSIGSLNTENIKILKGTDNIEYIVFLIKEEHPFLDGKINPFISNENGKLLYEFKYQLGGSKWIEDSNSKLYYETNNSEENEFLIEEDKIYFLDYPDVNIDSEGTYFQENILTINNNQINIEKGEIYKGNVAGAE